MKTNERILWDWKRNCSISGEDLEATIRMNERDIAVFQTAIKDCKNTHIANHAIDINSEKDRLNRMVGELSYLKELSNGKSICI